MTKSADTDKMMTKDKKAAAELDTETEERDRQTVTVTATEVVTAAAIRADVKTERMTDFKSRMNIRLLTTIQMILKVLLISQMSLLCFHIDQSDVR